MRRLRIVAMVVVAVLSWPAAPAEPAPAAPASTSIRSGRWSDPSIWRPAGVPRASAAVTIGKGTTVTYDNANSGELGALMVEGALTFSRERSTRLEAGGIMVRGGGVLEIGTTDRPIPAGVSAELLLVVPPGAVFKGGGFVEGDIGLWVLAGGRWEVHGRPFRHTWMKLARPAPAGSASLFVREDVTDWPVGAEVLVTPSGASPGDADFEERRVAQVRRGAQGLYEIRLSAPLARVHEGGEEPGAVAAEVALLSRNVRIASKYPDRTRAHTMYMTGAHGELAYADVADLGTLGVLGRYPIHFHMMGESSRGMTLRGLTIRRSGNHFLNVHASNGVSIEDVVGYDVAGSGFFLENSFTSGVAAGERPEDGGGAAPSPGAGRETRRGRRESEPVRRRRLGSENVDVTFIHNLAARGVWRSGSHDRPNVALFWITSLNVVLLDNVAVGARGGKNNTGFRIDSGTPPAEGGVRFAMARNEARGNDDHGLLVWLNNKEPFDVVEFQARRNGRSGMFLGAYDPRYSIHRATLAENGDANLSIWIAQAYVQDSVLADAPVGLFFNRHFVPGDPEAPARFVNVRFSGHATADVSQEHRACPIPAEERSAYSRRCPAAYAVFVQSAFGSRRAFDFGWHVNAYSWFEILNPRTPLAGLPTQFRLSRRDRESEGTLHPPFDGRVRSVQRSWDMPPRIEVDVASGRGGQPAVLRARVSDDRGVKAVEVFVNGRLVRRLTAPPFDLVLSADAAGGQRTYLYARAIDAAGNVSYSPILRLQPPLP